MFHGRCQWRSARRGMVGGRIARPNHPIHSGNRGGRRTASLFDIDAVKRHELELDRARHYAEAIVETVRTPLLVLSGDLTVQTANAAFGRTFAVPPEATRGNFVYELGHRQWDIPELRKLLEQVLTENETVEDYRVEDDFPQIGRRSMLLNARRLFTENGQPQWILLAFEDVTGREGV